MDSMKVKCEIVTPLLMHGADGKKAELREQSFKGVMRFWWRAINGDLGLDDLKKKEAEIFGDTSKKSSFRMRIVDRNLETDNFNPLQHKFRKDGKPLFTIQGFSPNQTFEIEFRGRNLEKVKNIFILSTILGGFGQRARRGFGSIKILEIDGKNFNSEYSKVSIEELIKHINHSFSFNDKDFKSKGKYPYIKNIEIGKKYNDYKELLKQIGLATHKYPYFGSASRYASPLWISIVKEENKYKPLIVELNSPIYCCINLLNKNKIFKSLNRDDKRNRCIEFLRNFKKEIL
jgi:CRISPR-associated protein Cmr1